MISLLPAITLALAQISQGLTPAPVPAPTVLAPHYVTLTWTVPVPATQPATVTYKIRRSVGLCLDNPPFATIAQGITTMTFSDTTVSPGNWCYEVFTVYPGFSAISPMQLATVPQ